MKMCEKAADVQRKPGGILTKTNFKKSVSKKIKTFAHYCIFLSKSQTIFNKARNQNNVFHNVFLLHALIMVSFCQCSCSELIFKLAYIYIYICIKGLIKEELEFTKTIMPHTKRINKSISN